MLNQLHKYLIKLQRNFATLFLERQIALPHGCCSYILLEKHPGCFPFGFETSFLELWVS